MYLSLPNPKTLVTLVKWHVSTKAQLSHVSQRFCAEMEEMSGERLGQSDRPEDFLSDPAKWTDCP